MAFYFIRWLIPGQEPKGSQTFNTERAARSYARRASYAHPSWTAEVVRHHDGEQDVVARLGGSPCRLCAEGSPVPHEASKRCESGRRPHCTCDSCY